MTPADLESGAATVLAWLLTYAMHSTILLAAAAAAAWRFADHHAWLDVMWKTAVTAPLVTASLSVGPMTFSPAGRWTVASLSPTTARPMVSASEPVPARHDSGAGVATRSLDGADRAARPKATAAAVARPPAFDAMQRRSPLIVAAAWVIISSFLVVPYAARLRRTYRTLRSGPPAPADLLTTIDQLRTTMPHRQIRLTTSTACPVPLALGNGQIVVPERFVLELDAEQQRAALAHEVAHLARRDPAWRIAVEILERVLFFQPLNRLARARLCEAAEFLCDEWAVRQTRSPLALARCLAVVASWRPPAALPAGVSAMARRDSAMVRRVTRILNEVPSAAVGPRAAWLLVPVSLVALAAPHVTAAQLPAASAVASGGAPIAAMAGNEIRVKQSPARQSSAAEITAARAQIRDYQSPRVAGSLAERWRQALAAAAAERLGEFWIVYSFTTPIDGDELVLGDTRDGVFVSSNGRIGFDGLPLTAVLNRTAVPLEGSSVAVAMHYGGARPDAIDRAAYRSVQLGFDFGRAPVFWLGDAPEADSFTQVQNLFAQARVDRMQALLIELASMHGDTDVVAPFLARLLERSWPAHIRREAAEGFSHHHDPRSVEILLRVARTDQDSTVRAEAAEAIGEVQTPQSLPALSDLARNSDDPDVRREAAEGFGDQPAAGAIPAIESVIATSDDEAVVGEAIEALGEIGDPAALPVLLQIVNSHRSSHAREEAVETIGELDAPGAVEALTRIVQEHPDVTVQREAVETLGDRQDDAPAIAALERIAREHEQEEVQAEAIETIAGVNDAVVHPLVLDLVVNGRSPRIRREALDALEESLSNIADEQELDRAEAAIERAIFNDPEMSVRLDALDALEALPGERAVRGLRDVIARHPDARVRREAEERMK